MRIERYLATSTGSIGLLYLKTEVAVDASGGADYDDEISLLTL